MSNSSTTTTVDDLNIPEDAAAIVCYANGVVAMHLPKAGADEDLVPDNTLIISAFGLLLANHPERVSALIDEFMGGEEIDASSVVY